MITVRNRKIDERRKVARFFVESSLKLRLTLFFGVGLFLFMASWLSSLANIFKYGAFAPSAKSSGLDYSNSNPKSSSQMQSMWSNVASQQAAKTGSQYYVTPQGYQAQPSYKPISPVNAPSGSYNQLPSVNQSVDQINQSVDDYGAMIESDFNNTMNYLSGEEQGLRSTADTSQRQIQNEWTSTQNEIANQQTQKVGSLQGDLATGEKQGATALQGARDLFRQMQQQNIVQLSGAGLSSSSVNEALAEKLGVETMKRIGSITGSLQEMRTNIQKEIQRTNDYYTSKKNTLEEQKNIELGKINASLLSGLNQINYARNQAQADKAARRYELIQNAQAEVAKVQAEARKIQDSLTNWAGNKNKSLEAITADENLMAALKRETDTLNQNFTLPGWQYAPSYDQYGNYKGQVMKRTYKDEDEENQGQSWQSSPYMNSAG